MADFDIEPPSFSLGLDLDVDLELRANGRPETPLRPSTFSSAAANLRLIEEEDDDFESPTKILQPQVADPPRTLKRLRRGPTTWPIVKAQKKRFQEAWCNVDEEVEEFSSEEDFRRGKFPPLSVCSSSKPSLHEQRVLTSQHLSRGISRKTEEVPNASASVNGETGSNNVLVPTLTASPLRRFQLIDADSDDDRSVSEDTCEEVVRVEFPSKDKLSKASEYKPFSNLRTENASVGKSHSEDFLDFFLEKSFSVPTPASDEVCEEYFSSMKKKSKTEITCNEPTNGTKSDATSVPPAHCYLFHKDARIRNLVRERLPHFFPLGAGNSGGPKQQSPSLIDYMGQFNHEDNSRQADRASNVKKSSKITKKNVKAPVESGNWVNPKNCAGPQKDACKRRVQAASKSAGHWYTGADGRRVYVNKSGQELTGQIAYRHYRKESGVGFKNSKKKTKKASVKKKAAWKKK